MRALVLFRPTFQRLRTTIEHSQIIKDKVLPKAGNSTILQQLDRTMFILNCLDHVAVDLQSSEVNHQLHKFELMMNSMKMRVSYDYEGKGFKMIQEESLNQKITNLQMHLRSLPVQKVDHPILRQSLYFHELKNIDQLMKINYPRNAPNFIRDIYRRNVENDILDKENPLGVPLKAPPLEILLQLNRLFTAQLYCRYGYINIRSIRMLKEEVEQSGERSLYCSHYINGLNIPRQIQKGFYELCQNTIGLKEPQLYLLHKIGYIGGRIEQMELLLKLYQFYTDVLPIE